MADQDYQPRPDVIEHPVRDPRAGFDMRVHIKDAKTGEMLKIQPYVAHIVGGRTYFERPIGSGNLYDEGTGKPCGRWEKQEDGKFGVAAGKEHIDYVSPKSDYLTVDSISQENEALRAELAAYKAESAARVKEAPQAAPAKKA